MRCDTCYFATAGNDPEAAAPGQEDAAIPEEGNDRLAFEEQLQELTETLKTLEGNLGQTELEAQKTKRNWDSKMEEVYKHIYDPATILNIDASIITGARDFMH